MERLLLSYLMIIILGIHPDASGEKPMLIPSDSELVIQEGNELRIECNSNLQTPLHFSYPEYTIMSPRSTHEIQYGENGTLTFLRRSAVSLDTGWYACAAESIEIENDFKTLNHTHENISWIYVYVSSSEPFADHYYTFPKIIIVLAGSPGIVPCRPTLPNLDIKLWKNFRIINPNEQLSFDPKIGFIVEPPSSEDLEAVFQCKVNDIEDVYVLRYSNATGRKPRMNVTGDELILLERDELRIECYGATNIQFAFPNVYTGYYPGLRLSSVHEFSSDEEGKRTFIRRSVSSDDTGWYGCAEEGINFDIPPFYLDYTKKEINWIYVYVESVIFPLLGGKSSAVVSMLNTSALMPCRPTSPKFNVTLKTKFEIVNLDENVQFHPKLGFLLRRDLRSSETCYQCSVTGYRSDTSECFYSGSTFSPSPLIDYDSLLLLTGEDLHLSCRTRSFSVEIILLEWNTPTTVSKKRVERSPKRSFDRTEIIDGFVQYFEVTLTVKNVTENDSGQYNCTFRDTGHETKTSANVTIYDHRSVDHIIDSERSPYRFVGLRGQSVKWMMKNIRSIVNLKIMWYTPSNTLIEFSSDTDKNKYKLQQSSDERLFLEIFNLTSDDAGLYRVVIPAFFKNSKEVKVTLEIQAPPSITIDGASETYYTAPGKTFETIFTINGSPRPNVTCSFINYPILGPNEDAPSMIPWKPEDNFDEHEFRQVAALKMSTNISGSLTCTGCNSYNCSSDSKLIYVTDDIRDLAIVGSEENVYVGDDAVMTCAAPTPEFQNLSWNEKFNECYENVDRKMFYIIENQTQYTIRRVLHMKNVTKCHQRLYSCWGQTIEGDIVNSSYHLHVRSPKKPRFTRNNMNGSKITSISKSVAMKTISLYCCADGDPSPSTSWFQDNVRIKESPIHKVSSLDCQLNVILNYLPDKDGRYTCKAQNRFGEIEDYVYFVAEGGDEQNGNPLIVIISSILVLIVLLVASFVIRKYRKKIANERLKEAILRRFDEGELNRLNSTLDIVDQAEILPYDNEWEYPRKMLKLGKVLGSGAFGIVRRAEAKSIRPGERVTTVAVKMVRPTSTLHHMMALSRELKVLVHLGQHLNIVNLLGACTKNVSYGELLVIVEFCRFGNLQDYLSRRRADFIDQVDPITGEIDASDLSTDQIDVDDNDANTNCDVVSENCRSADSSMDINVAADEGIAPGLRSEYRGDYTDVTARPIRTKDLLSWAWQVSRGMRYLGVRKVVHGDLAARNILLADNNVIKICDFGLAKALYKADYHKMGEGDPLPLKWMAVEAITDLRFSVESDIWSFGIVLWEFFSLAESPYPGIHPKYVYQKLLEGYRMDKPKYAPKIIYRLMMNCWEAEPANRPSFGTIENAIYESLDDSVKMLQYYTDFSNEYNNMRTGIHGTGKIDYLTMDPAQKEAVSRSVKPEELELSNVLSKEPPKSIDSDTSSLSDNCEAGPSPV